MPVRRRGERAQVWLFGYTLTCVAHARDHILIKTSWKADFCIWNGYWMDGGDLDLEVFREYLGVGVEVFWHSGIDGTALLRCVATYIPIPTTYGTYCRDGHRTLWSIDYGRWTTDNGQ